jgi:hypothetical protein
VKLATGGEGHEVMAPLLISRGSETDSSDGACVHVVCVLLVGLNVCPELESHMFVVIEMLASEKVARR